MIPFTGWINGVWSVWLFTTASPLAWCCTFIWAYKLFEPVLLRSYFPLILSMWKENHPLNAVRFFYVYLPLVRVESSPRDSEFETFSSPNCSKFAVESDWNSKISERGMKFFLKKMFLFKIGKGHKFAVECLSNDIISWKWCLFHLNCEVFFVKKNQKSLKFEKIRKYMTKVIKKRFHPFKRLL